MDKPRIDQKFKDNKDTGFGVQTNQLGERFINRDGSFNIIKTGWPWHKRLSVYSWFMELNWLQFLIQMFILYALVNLIFTLIYVVIGIDQLRGFESKSLWGKIVEVYFFSTQTFTTVGYGRINPVQTGADAVAAIESMCGWLFFALVTGLVYGRFTQPKAYLAFSNQALIAPFSSGRALMFRLVPYKGNHHLTDAKIVVNAAFTVTVEGKLEFKFFRLNLERDRVDMLSMNWTVVHPLDKESPLQHFTAEDMEHADVEIYVQITGFNPIFSNTVIQRTSYTYREIVWNAKFKSMYHESEDGRRTILELQKLNDYERTS